MSVSRGMDSGLSLNTRGSQRADDFTGFQISPTCLFVLGLHVLALEVVES